MEEEKKLKAMNIDMEEDKKLKTNYVDMEEGKKIKTNDVDMEEKKDVTINISISDNHLSAESYSNGDLMAFSENTINSKNENCGSKTSFESYKN